VGRVWSEGLVVATHALGDLRCGHDRTGRLVLVLRDMTSSGLAACEANPSLGCSGFRHGLARLDRGADWRERQEVEEGGDRRAIIELAPIKQVADLAEGNPRHPGCLGGVGRWSLQGRPVGLVEVEAGIADTDVGAVGAQ